MFPMFAEDWRDYAACSDVGPGMFFDDSVEGFAAAKLVCSGCPVQFDCLDFALSTNQVGTWGGTNDHNRRNLRRALKVGGPATYELELEFLFDPPDPSLSPATPERPCPRCDSIIPARPAGEPYPPDRNSPGATCGKPVTYNKGCRCLVCSDGKSAYNRGETFDPSPRGETGKMGDQSSNDDTRRTA